MRDVHVRQHRPARAWAVVWGLLALLSIGCASTVRQAAKEAAPAAVEGAVEEAEDPETRDDLARIIADPGIRDATTQLAQALTEGVVLGLADPERGARMQQVIDQMVMRVGSALARSVQRDIGPELAVAFSGAVDLALQRALSEDNQARMQELARALSHGVVQGMGESLIDPATGLPRPGYEPIIGALAREVTRQAAFGFEDAVQEARATAGESDERGQVLAAMGALADFALLVPTLLVAGLILILLLGAAALIWAVMRLRHHRRVAHAREAAALALARAIKDTEGRAWSDELRAHIARAEREDPELRELLREHRELELRPRADGPRSERSPHVS